MNTDEENADYNATLTDDQHFNWLHILELSHTTQVWITYEYN